MISGCMPGIKDFSKDTVLHRYSSVSNSSFNDAAPTSDAKDLMYVTANVRGAGRATLEDSALEDIAGSVREYEEWVSTKKSLHESRHGSEMRDLEVGHSQKSLQGSFIEHLRAKESRTNSVSSKVYSRHLSSLRGQPYRSTLGSGESVAAKAFSEVDQPVASKFKMHPANNIDDNEADGGSMIVSNSQFGLVQWAAAMQLDWSAVFIPLTYIG